MNLHRSLGSAALCLALAAAASAAEEASSLQAALSSVTEADLRKHVGALADDTFEGREAGSSGGRAASIYLGKEFQRFGLRGAGDRGGYYQVFGAGYRNILGWIEGSDPQLKKEYVLVGAHYDHVGYGSSQNSYGPTGYIHNGADDNASGSAALLEIAEGIATSGLKPRRSILFALWDAEEKGLLGSKHWVGAPTIPFGQIRLVINTDMLGRMRRNRLEVAGTRSAAGLRRAISSQNEGTDLWLDFTWELKDNSDHWPFYERRIPILMMHTGLHDDYHRPSDDAEKVNVDGLRQASQFMVRVVMALADANELPKFRPAATAENEHRQREVEQPAAPLPGRLGLRWDEQEKDGQGVRVAAVTPGAAAAQAGLRAGDRILTWNDLPVLNGDQLRSLALSSENPVIVGVARAGQEQPQPVTVNLGGKPVRVGIAWRTDDAEPGAVILNRVAPGSPADKAGLRVHDRIYQLAGNNFADEREFITRLQEAAGPVEVVYERFGKLGTVTMQLPGAGPQ